MTKIIIHTVHFTLAVKSGCGSWLGLPAMRAVLCTKAGLVKVEASRHPRLPDTHFPFFLQKGTQSFLVI